MPLRDLDSAIPNHATLLVGPEGGWTVEEVRVAAELGTLVKNELSKWKSVVLRAKLTAD